jgi:hypothetical protein
MTDEESLRSATVYRDVLSYSRIVTKVLNGYERDFSFGGDSKAVVMLDEIIDIKRL